MFAKCLLKRLKALHKDTEATPKMTFRKHHVRREFATDRATYMRKNITCHLLVKPDRKAKFREAQGFDKTRLTVCEASVRWQILPYVLRIGDGGVFGKRQPNICTNAQ